MIENGVGESKEPSRVSNNIVTQYKEIQQKLQSHQLTIVNRIQPLVKISENKTIMEQARDFVKEKELRVNCVDEINYVRLYKKILLPTELVGGRKGKQTEAYNRIDKVSLLK